jgi:DNA-binding LacI/PurR family transcriptional regulator
MCGRVIEYQRELIYFPNRDARLLVQLNNGNVLWVIWGKYKKEANRDFFQWWQGAY